MYLLSTYCYDVKLTGKDEVPSKDTTATSNADFNVIDNNTINYTVNGTGIQKATSAHIHQGKAGENWTSGGHVV